MGEWPPVRRVARCELDGKGKATPSAARSGLESLSVSAIRRNGLAICFGKNTNVINTKSAIRESSRIADTEKKVAG